MTPVVTVAELVEQRGLALRPREMPHPDTPVRWVAVSDLVDPSPFLEGGEVLLTTGLEATGWRAEWRAYVDRLARAGVAAIGFAVGLSHVRVPSDLRTACRDAGMNLFEVPRRTTFVAVSRAVAERLHAADQAAARAALELQRSLTRAALEKGGPGSLLGSLAAGTGGATLLCNVEGTVRVGPVGPRTDLLEPEAVSGEVGRLRRHGLRAAASVTVPGGTLLVQPVGVHGTPESYLAVALPGRPDDLQRGAVMTTVSLLGLSAGQSRDARDTERRLRARALKVLLEGDRRTAQLLLDAGGAGTATSLPEQAVVVLAEGDAAACEEAQSALEPRHRLSGLLHGRVVAVAAPGEVATVLRRLSRLPSLRVGVGEVADVGALHRSRRTAEQALSLTTASNAVVRWDTTVRHGALALLDPARAEAFCDSFLAPLRGPEEAELLETLRAFLHHHGALTPVAQDLGVHRNTVRNRLARIQEALGRSLEDPQVRVDAWLALQVSAAVDR
jgi:purine catabolism regulator